MSLFIQVTVVGGAGQTFINPIKVTHVQTDPNTGNTHIYIDGGLGPVIVTETPAQLSAAADAAWETYLQGISGVTP